MKVFELPLLTKLQDSRKILLAGAGGGFDVFCGLPLYFALRQAGKEVVLANLTFSNLYGASGHTPTPESILISRDSGGSSGYFPERYLCCWFKERRNEDVSIYCFHRSGVAPLRAAYKVIVELEKIDAVVLVDGGTDSLMRGDEAGLGTPQEDSASIAAAAALAVPTKLLVCLGFGVDSYHGVFHADFLESVAALTKEGAFHGAFSIQKGMPEVDAYYDAAEYVFKSMPDHPSIVSSSIMSALDGDFGDIHRTERTRGSILWINPLMSLYWIFDLRAVAMRNLYLTRIANTKSYEELTAGIRNYRNSLPSIRRPSAIPL